MTPRSFGITYVASNSLLSDGTVLAASSMLLEPHLPTVSGSPVASLETSLVAQLVKNLPAMRETWARSLGWEDLLEKEKATHSSILAWRIPWTVQSMGSQRVGHS